ncbi:lysophospholipase [Lujinxingia vulgaris]|uniref:Monoacylglycerol lipase n=2 Tax=Lujinxingia vulgaris TaxID=2600176 RepID=A0A5C6X8Y8_9DELT|nr:lysophospholipase [Lujinxingia vulgaris]
MAPAPLPRPGLSSMARPQPAAAPELTPIRWSSDTFDPNIWEDLAPGRRAPLDAVERDEGYISTPDHQQLYWQTWRAPKVTPRAVVALMHGYAEHSARYDHVGIALARAGYAVMAIDARGHGRSTGRRGHVERFDDYVDDLELLIRRAGQRWPDLPLFVMGHSNGGLIALRLALRKPQNVRAFVITSPLLGVAPDLSPVMQKVGLAAARILPTLTIASGIDPGALTHLKDVIDHHERDPLNFPTATAGWFSEAVGAMKDAHRRAGEVEHPALLLVAGDDRIVNARETERFFHQMGSHDRQLELLPGLYHEVLNEEPWRDLLARALFFMEDRRDPAND